jgi:hypothetical protein
VFRPWVLCLVAVLLAHLLNIPWPLENRRVEQTTSGCDSSQQHLYPREGIR